MTAAWTVSAIFSIRHWKNKASQPRRFIPATDADFIGYDEQAPATVLIHRDYIEAIVERTAETDELLQTE